MGLGRSEVDWHAVRDRRLTRPVASSTAPLELALRELTGQARATPSGAVDVAVDGLRRNSGLPSVPFHPPGDLLGRPSQGKAVRDGGAQAGVLRRVERAIRDPRSFRAQARRSALSGL